jgi:hypothetical protein
MALIAKVAIVSWFMRRFQQLRDSTPQLAATSVCHNLYYAKYTHDRRRKREMVSRTAKITAYHRVSQVQMSLGGAFALENGKKTQVGKLRYTPLLKLTSRSRRFGAPVSGNTVGECHLVATMPREIGNSPFWCSGIHL